MSIYLTGQYLHFDSSTFITEVSVKKYVKGFPVTIYNDECKETFWFPSRHKAITFFRRLVEFVMDAENAILRHGVQPSGSWVDSEKFSVSDSGLFRIDTAWEGHGTFQELSITENPDGACRIFETAGQTKQ